MPAEEAQWQGRTGVLNVKRWLEATMRFSLRYDAYENPVRTTLETVDGVKRFDLRGDRFDETYGSPSEIYVEVKNYTTEGSLSSDWIDFVANAYSATHVLWDRLGRDPQLDFMFASTHPWSSSKYWSMTEPESVKEACESRANLMPEGGPLEDRVQALSSRLFLWVISRRQEDMTMGRKFRGYVMERIGAGEN